MPAKRTHKVAVRAKDEEEKKAAPSVGVRRKAKQADKEGDIRVSKRLANKGQVSYDEKAVDKLID